MTARFKNVLEACLYYCQLLVFWAVWSFTKINECA